MFGGEAATSLFFFFVFFSILDCSTIHCTVVGNFFYINAQSATDLKNNVVSHQTIKKTSDKEPN